MESLLIKYLEKYGFINGENRKLIEKDIQISNSNSDFSNLIDFVQKLLSNKTNVKNLSKQIYENFIKEDDEHIIKLFRKLLVIKRHHLKIKIVYYFNKWKIKTYSKDYYNNKVCQESLNINKKGSHNSKNSITKQTEESIYKMKLSEKNLLIDEEKLIDNRLKRPKDFTNKSVMNDVSKIAKNNSESNIVNSEKHKPDNKCKKEDHFSKLYEERLVRQKKQEKNMELKQKMDLEQCTFKPKLLSKSNSLLFMKSNIDYFNNVNNEMIRKEEKIKKLAEEKENLINNDCTFEPSINKNYSTKMKSMNFLERVKHFNQNKEKKLHRLSAEYNTIEKNHSHSSLKRNRVKNINVEKNKRIHEIEEKMIIEKGLTFKPKLNEEKIRYISSNFFERNKQFVNNKTIKIKSAVSHQELECTFSPKINQNFESIIMRKDENSDIPKSNGSVQRLFNYHKIYDQKKEELRESFKESFPFKPQISKNTDIILKNKQNFIKQMNQKIEKNIEKRGNQISPESREKIEEIRREVNKDLKCNSIEESKEFQNKMNSLDITDLSRFNKTSSKNLSSSLKNSERSSISKQPELSILKDNNKFVNTKPHFLEKLSDNQLLALANDYITTDESLDQLKKSGKNFNSSDKNHKISNCHLRETSQINDTKSVGQISKKMSNKQLKNNKEFSIPKNVDKALEFYKLVQS